MPRGKASCRFLKPPNVYVGNPEDCRRFLSVIVWITKQSAPWRALPKVYGYCNSIYRRFGHWCDAGIFENFMNIFMRRVKSTPSSLIRQSWTHIKTSSNNHFHGGVILYYDDNMHLSSAYYMPSIGWQSLSVRLYFLEDLPDIFVPIYSANGDDIASVKVWEIHYPPDIKTDEKYLTTQPEPTQ